MRCLSKIITISNISHTGASGGGGEEFAQLEWARRESVRAEEDRRRKMAEQEAADLEFALALSRAEAQGGK